MASEIRVDKINSLSGVGTVTLSPTGVDIAGITTAATLRATTGIVTSLTAGSLTSLGAVSGTTGTFTGNVSIADKIVHTGDTNTAIRFPAADTFTVETGGSERFRVDSTGNTLIYGAIRKDNISSSLAISGGNAADSSANIVLNGSSGSPANVTQFRTGSTERLRIDSSGRVITGAVSTADTGTYYDDITINNSNTASGAAGGAGLSLVCGATSYGGVIFSNNSSHGRGYMKYDMTNDRLILGTQTVDRLMIEDSGNNGDVHIKTGNIVFDTAGRGIDFSATANSGGSMSSELLDDYEEGTFTPILYYSSGTSGVAYNVQEGRYTKVGRLVSFQIRLALSNKGSGNNNVRIGGLPFTPETGGVNYDYFMMSAVVGCNLGAGRVPFAQMEDYSAGRITLYSFDYASSNNYAEINNSSISSNFNMGMQGNYITAS